MMYFTIVITICPVDFCVAAVPAPSIEERYDYSEPGQPHPAPGPRKQLRRGMFRPSQSQPLGFLEIEIKPKIKSDSGLFFKII